MLHLETVEPGTFSLLKKIAALPALSNFRLCGGTSLSLQIGHRISVDLDFFCQSEIDLDQLLDDLNLDFQIDVNYRNPKVLSCMVEKVKVDFVKYHYPWIGNPIESEGVILCSLYDIAAMKLEAIKGRGRKRDFVDLYYLLKNFSLQEMLEFNLKKYRNNDQTLILKSLTYFIDAEEDTDPNTFEKLNWEKVKKQIITEVKSIIKNL
jgi:predicted nucleotidyltransferase component of viral defense system